ncbi:MAG: CopG family transcriptional regulator [Cyanobacteria bacterium P01_C01_bin.69]
MSAYSLELSPELTAEAQKLATENQVPLSQWLTSAISAKIEAEKTRRLLESYAKKADYEKFDAVLARVPDVPPMEGDEL